jgi:precorrin-3B methylase
MTGMHHPGMHRPGKGRLLGLGVGPGDPELITLKALRLLKSAPVVGYFVAKAKASAAMPSASSKRTWKTASSACRWSTRSPPKNSSRH